MVRNSALPGVDHAMVESGQGAAVANSGMGKQRQGSTPDTGADPRTDRMAWALHLPELPPRLWGVSGRLGP
jgi:hypothetical protein